METDRLLRSFQETLALSTKGALKDKTRMAIRRSQVYPEGFTAPSKTYGRKGSILVEPSPSLDSAHRHRGDGRVAVLNFAHPTIPAGGMTGSMATQEGYLCQCTNLYPCLAGQAVSAPYYGYHKALGHPFGSDRLIYSRDITVFKDSFLRVLKPPAWFDVDIITCSPPIPGNARSDRKELKQRLKKRMVNILEAAAANEVQVLILGAFGCGTSKNPPEVAASAFYEAIDEGRYPFLFKKIVFAIKGVPENRMAFQAAFDAAPLPGPYPLSHADGASAGTVPVPPPGDLYTNTVYASPELLGVDVEKMEEQLQALKGTQKFCPKCGSANIPESSFCGTCGARLPAGGQAKKGRRSDVPIALVYAPPDRM